MQESRQECFVNNQGTLTYVPPSYGAKGKIKTWYFAFRGQEHVPGRYTLRWREYPDGKGFLQIKKNPRKFKFPCSLETARRVFALEESTGDTEADRILAEIGPTKVVFMIEATREHFCEGPKEKVRVTRDIDIKVFRPNGVCMGSLPERCECKVYGDLSLEEALKKYRLEQTDVPIKKRSLAFRMRGEVRLGSTWLMQGREIEVKFDSRLGYGETIAALRKINLAKVRFVWQSSEHAEQVDTHVYYRSADGAFREVWKNGELMAIVRKTDKQSVDREETICQELLDDAKLLGGMERRKFHSFVMDTVTGHCFQLAVDEAIRHSDGAVMVQVEVEYTRSVYPWSTEEEVFQSLERFSVPR